MHETTQRMNRLARIVIYPIKSLDCHEVSAASLLDSGAIAGDRRFRLVDELGKTVSVRNTRDLTQVRCLFTDAVSRVTLTAPDRTPAEFDLVAGESSITDWISNFLGRRVWLEENRTVGFPDDLEASGPTLVSTATLERLHNWFPAIDISEHFRRMRGNLLIEADEPFWEDRLVGEAVARRFAIGDVIMRGEKVCQRCVVPSLDSRTGEPTREFTKKVAKLRAQELPDWSPAGRFDHFYRVAINTNLDAERSGPNRTIAVGNNVQLID